jgi:hypothetical protein
MTTPDHDPDDDCSAYTDFSKTIALTEEGYETLMNLVENPPPPSPALLALLRPKEKERVKTAIQAAQTAGRIDIDKVVYQGTLLPSLAKVLWDALASFDIPHTIGGLGPHGPHLASLLASYTACRQLAYPDVLRLLPTHCHDPYFHVRPARQKENIVLLEGCHASSQERWLSATNLVSKGFSVLAIVALVTEEHHRTHVGEFPLHIIFPDRP